MLASQHVAANKGEAFSVNVIDEPSQIYAKDFINLFITKVKLSNTLRFTLIIFFFKIKNIFKAPEIFFRTSS